jgi:tubulin monoglycylase TTLL3/8
VEPEIRRIILSSLTSVMDTVEPRKGTCELFGYDFMFSEDPARPRNLRTWLIEVNSSPAMDYSTEVTLPLVKKVMEDVPKVLFDIPEKGPDADTGEWALMHKAEQTFQPRPPALVGAKLEVIGKKKRRPKPKKKKKKKKKKAAEKQSETKDEKADDDDDEDDGDGDRDRDNLSDNNADEASEEDEDADEDEETGDAAESDRESSASEDN